MKVNPDSSVDEVNQALMDPNTQIFQQALLTSSRHSSQARSTLSQVQSRHNDILRIERQIQELAQLFNELGIMVNEQEIQIDQIGQKAADTQLNLELGTKEVTRATKFAEMARQKKWWCFWLVVLIIVIVVVVPIAVHFVHTNNSSSSGSSTPAVTVTATPSPTP